MCEERAAAPRSLNQPRGACLCEVWRHVGVIYELAIVQRLQSVMIILNNRLEDSFTRGSLDESAETWFY